MDVIALEHRSIVGIGLGAVLFGETLGAFLIQVGDGHETRAGQLGNTLGVNRTDVSAADDCETNF